MLLAPWVSLVFFIQYLKASFGTTGLLCHDVTRLTTSPSSVPPLLAVTQHTAAGDLKLHDSPSSPMKSNVCTDKLKQHSDLIYKCDVEKNGSAVARSTEPSGERNIVEVWDQIRRTEKDLMEMGTMDNTLPQDHGAGTEGLVRTAETLSGIGV